ncbi:MAG: hypothetical protein ACR2QM_12215 [Longimicrobiales bacterium]
MKTLSGALLLAMGLALTGPIAAQGQAPEADPNDVNSVDAIIVALYDVISGPAGEARDWDRFRSLFAEGARLVPTFKDAEGQVRFQVWSPAEYAERAGPGLMESGFFEREIGRVEDRFGNIVQLFSTYDSKRSEDDPEPFARGINSIQLLDAGDRFWIMTVFWDSERPDNPIPNKYKTPHPG